MMGCKRCVHRPPRKSNLHAHPRNLLVSKSLPVHGALVDDVPVKKQSRSPALPEIDTAEGFLPHNFHHRWASVLVRRY